MLKKLRKHLRQKRAAAALALALAMAYPAAPVCADTGKQSFNDGHAHTVTDNIAVTDDHGLETWHTGTSATMIGKTITVSGATHPGYAAVARDGSKITLTNVAASSMGWGIAIFPDVASGSEIAMTGGSVTTTEGMGIGVYANGGGMITLTNVAVRTMGSNSHGVVSDSVLPAMNVIMTGGSITTEGADSHGVYASHSGAITLTDVAVRTTGAMFSNGAYGIYADHSGRVTMTGGSITTTGNGNHGASAVDTASVELTNVTVRTEGTGSHGLGAAYYVFSPTIVPGGTIRMTGGSITTAGMGSYGAHAAHGGKIFLTNTDVSTAGIGSWGLYAVDAGSKITTTGGSIATTGVGGNGVYCVTGGAAVLTNTAISTTGLGGTALYTDSGGTITASVNGQNLYSTGSLAISSGGEITVTADGASRLTGTIAALGGTINLTLQGASTLTGVALAGGGTVNFTLNGNAAWTTSAESNISRLTLNGGTVKLARPAALPLLLRVLGPLEGAGGTFRTSMNINDDTQSDRVIIQGVASGSHRFEVAVVGGYPTDLYRVVQLVDMNNALANTATFGGGSDVGPYRYGVAKGTALSSAYNGLVVGSEEDYYLYNTFGPSTPANAAIGTALGGSTMWYGEVNEIRKRLGDLRDGAASGDGLWARTYASEYDIKPGDGQGFGQRMYGLEVGSDAPRKYAGGTRHTGWVAGSGWANRSFDMGGHGDTNSLYVGGYASWLKDDGAYWDIVAKQNWFRHSFDVPRLGSGNDSAVYDTTGFGLSVETGKRFTRGDGAFFEPQAELAALWTKGKSYTTAAGLAVNARAETSLQLRVGAVFGRQTATAAGGTRQVYGKLAWIEELAGEGRTTVDGVAFASTIRGGRLVGGAGLTLDTAKSQLFFDVERAWGSRTEKKWGLNLGCRWKF